MNVFKGIKIYGGKAYQKVKIFVDNTPPENNSLGFEEELKRYYNARENVIKDIDVLIKQARTNKQNNLAGVFEAHKLIANDPMFEDLIKKEIEKGNSAETSIINSCRLIKYDFLKMVDNYLKERYLDFREVSKSLVAKLDNNDVEFELNEKVIIVCNDLGIRQLAKINKNYIAGLVFIHGGLTSHVALFTKSLGIPSICNLENATIDDFKDGDLVYLNANEGICKINPDENEIDESFVSEEVSGKNRRIKKYANINFKEDAVDVKNNKIKGIGLYRTEYFYLMHNAWPSLNEIYFDLEEMQHVIGNIPFVIRTFDFSSDKMPNYVSLDGVRGIDAYKKYEDEFLKQLEAILILSKHHNIRLLIPMINTKEDALYIKECIDKIRAKYDIKYKIKLGFMVETKEALENIKDIVSEAEFISIGTNDLTESITGINRKNSTDMRLNENQMKEILDAISTISKEANKKHISVSICGDLATYDDLYQLYKENKIDYLSVPIPYIIKKKKRGII